MDTDIIVETRICRVERLGEQSVSFHFFGNHDHTEKEFDELIEKTNQKMNFKKFVAFNDMRGNLGSFTPEIRKYVSNHPEIIKYKYAEALVVDNLSLRLQANFFIKFTPKKMKLKVFNDPKKAKDWLRKRLKEIE